MMGTLTSILSLSSEGEEAPDFFVIDGKKSPI